MEALKWVASAVGAILLILAVSVFGAAALAVVGILGSVFIAIIVIGFVTALIKEMLG